ncbi:MAG: hypothetical protein HY270_13350 [Deltaproteobacteria bacterium]|nr:hypothetical protein [Deltaproteobacteria bacterium]
MDQNGYYVAAPNQSALGSNWDGLLYERAVAAGQFVENVLRIGFSVQRQSNNPIARVHATYRLYESICYRLGGIEVAGIMQRNSGELTATPIDDTSTSLTCTKTIRYGRLTNWSAAGPFDLGQMLNYLAPAFLCLWVNEVRLVVPCGQRTTISN